MGYLVHKQINKEELNMLYAATSIIKSINILSNYNKTINDKTDIEKAKIRLLTELSLIK